jgi:hypothetical protein
VDRHRHRFDADPDPNPIFHFDADPDPDPDPDRILLQVLHMLENQKIYFAFFFVYNSASFCLFSVTGFTTFNVLDSILKCFLDKKVFFSLTFLVEIQ